VFQFEHIEAIYWLPIIPVLLLLLFFSLKLKQRQISKLGSKSIIQRLLPNWSIAREWTKILLLLLGLSLMIISWANPQWGTKTEKVTAERSDVIIALDISQSMMAEDISPNRLERAKRMAGELVKGLRGNRIGLIFFAGSAYLQMPLTTDYAAAELFLKSANTRQAGTQGTAIADAIDLSVSAFRTEKNTQKAVVVISDGENHDQEAIDAAALANESGTFVFTIGVGTEAGELIPVETSRGRVYKTDDSGQTVKSKLNIQLMQDIASAGGGEAYLLNQGKELIEDIKTQLNKLEKQEVEQRSFSEYESYFQYFLFFGILFLVIEFLLPPGRIKSAGK
jgi:Ca-activated chloride channel family protein